MGINGVGSSYAQNYGIQSRGRSTRGKSSVDDFACMGKATSLSEFSDNGKRGSMVEDRDSFTNGTMDYQRIISERRNEIYEKLKNGDTEESFQIGGSSFTEKEWDICQYLRGIECIISFVGSPVRESRTPGSMQGYASQGAYLLTRCIAKIYVRSLS